MFDKNELQRKKLLIVTVEENFICKFIWEKKWFNFLKSKKYLAASCYASFPQLWASGMRTIVELT